MTKPAALAAAAAAPLSLLLLLAAPVASAQHAPGHHGGHHRHGAGPAAHGHGHGGGGGGAPPAPAAAPATPSDAPPYAGFGGREAAGLSAQEAAGLRRGAGLGFALPAEVNGHPGPLHALELADALALTPAQRALFAAQVEAMRRETVPLGERLIAAERALDAVFRGGAATPGAVDAAAEAAALARGRVRAAHLRVHLATREAMTPEQIAAYARLRGYAP